MPIDPPVFDLCTLCADPAMFDSRESWRAAGFHVVDRDGSKEIMVGSHPSLPGYMIKKYTNKVRQKDQRKNYQLRIEGAAALKKLVDARGLRRILVPQKWLCTLPGAASPHLLLVERLNVIGRRDTRAAYALVNEATLGELCVVVHAFRGLDSGARNMLLTPDGKVAFIDTERWKDKKSKKSKKSYLKHIHDYLTPAQRAFAKQTFKLLDQG